MSGSLGNKDPDILDIDLQEEDYIDLELDVQLSETPPRRSPHGQWLLSGT